MAGIGKELLERLPGTFVPALNEKLQKWELLFPAEQRLISAQIGYMGEIPTGQFDELFAEIKTLESRMELPRWDGRSKGMMIDQVAMLARSPEYPKWRAEVERVFAHIDSSIESHLHQFSRLIVCILPAGVPVAKVNLWPDWAAKGQWLSLETSFGRVYHDFISAVVSRKLPAGIEPFEASWAIEYDGRLEEWNDDNLSVISWAALEAVRKEFVSRLNVIRKNLHSAGNTTAELQRMKIGPMLGERLSSPRMREFVRELLLSGNGALVFGNSFVQWGASETLRRIAPQMLVARFGIRNKAKPFSSIVMFEDQKQSNPVPDTEDPVGSLIDAEMLATYVHLAAHRLTPYRDRTLTIFAAEDLDRVLVLGPDKLPSPPRAESGKLPLEQFSEYVRGWLETSA